MKEPNHEEEPKKKKRDKKKRSNWKNPAWRRKERKKRQKRRGREEISVWWREKVKKKRMFEHMCGLECLTVGPIFIKYYKNTWYLSFQLSKTPKSCFHFPSSTSKILSFWVMETVIQNQDKQFVICETQSVWMMDHENWVISLNFHDIQTSS